MTAERRKVLDMLAAGKITPEEAEQFLNRLAPSGTPGNEPEGKAASATDAKKSEGSPRTLRFLRVVVDSPGRDSVNVRVPLGLVRTGLKLSALMPGRVSQRLSEQGIDLSHLGKLDKEALIAELAAHPIEVETEKGKNIRIFCE